MFWWCKQGLMFWTLALSLVVALSVLAKWTVATKDVGTCLSIQNKSVMVSIYLQLIFKILVESKGNSSLSTYFTVRVKCKTSFYLKIWLPIERLWRKLEDFYNVGNIFNLHKCKPYFLMMLMKANLVYKYQIIHHNKCYHHQCGQLLCK